MRLTRSTSALFASTALFTAPFASAQAVERNLLTWSGRVDREVTIEIRGRDVATHGSGLDASWSPRVTVTQLLPREPGVVRAIMQNGRGDVEVLENPSARNNYTALVRIRDTRSGADDYRVVLTYEANNVRDLPGNGRGPDNYPGRGGDNNPGRGRDDYPNRGDDRDRVEYDRNRRDAGALRWSGMVDGTAEIRIQGARIDAFAAHGNRLRDVHYDVMGSSLPRRDVRLEMVRTNGRGNVRIVQQPSVWNQYVAIVRIEDGRSGYGDYSFAVRW
ncbi:MAG: hypothetical protein ABJB74_03575 [Gemmatimonas sp.]